MEVSGHSLRVGAAQDLMIKGYDLATIMRAGGWSNAQTVQGTCCFLSIIFDSNFKRSINQTNYLLVLSHALGQIWLYVLNMNQARSGPYHSQALSL